MSFVPSEFVQGKPVDVVLVRGFVMNFRELCSMDKRFCLPVEEEVCMGSSSSSQESLTGIRLVGR